METSNDKPKEIDPEKKSRLVNIESRPLGAAGRIQISSYLRRHLKLREGDMFDIYLHDGKNIVLVPRPRKTQISEE